LDLQLPMQAVSITTDIVSSNSFAGGIIVQIWDNWSRISTITNIE